MSATLATVVYAFLILALFLLDRDRNSHVSLALWIPVTWLSICASRMVSQWLGVAALATESPDQFVEGSTLDALIFGGLLAAGLIVLLARRRRGIRFLQGNGVLLFFFCYCLVSVLWSDFPLVALKRWIKALGDLLMVLVVLTDTEPSAALKRLLARSGFLLVSLSILLIKYYPGLGREYSPWTGTPYNIGVATGKNGLGYVCLVFGLGSLWRLFEAFRGEAGTRRARTLVAHGTLLAMALWLFWMVDSATSFACFLIGGGLIAVTSLSGLARKPAVVHLYVGVVLVLAVYGLLLNPGAGLVHAMGRDPSLTGRTALWDQVLHVNVNPVFGAGYESFWLGDRLKEIWRTIWWHPNQAHNGYLEIFLDLGWIGVVLLGLVFLVGYRNVIRVLRRDPNVGRLRLAFLVAAAVYNLTEHAFRDLHPVWIIFLLAVTVIPDSLLQEVV
jgi:exopolysaccharide production protein ExoQ